MQLEHRLSALLQLHLHSQHNTWLQLIGQRQLHDEARNIYIWRLSATYIRELRVCQIINHAELTSMWWRIFSPPWEPHWKPHDHNVEFDENWAGYRVGETPKYATNITTKSCVKYVLETWRKTYSPCTTFIITQVRQNCLLLLCSASSNIKNCVVKNSVCV